MTYRTVVLPDVATLRASTVRLLTGLLDAGGSVIATGALPTRIDGVEDAAIAALTARFLIANPATDLGDVLDQCHAPDVTLKGPGAERIWLHPRRVGNTQVLFLFNTDRNQGAEPELALRGSGRLDAWELTAGRATPVPQVARDGWTVAPLHFAPGESHLLVLDEAAPSVTLPAPRMHEVRSVPLPVEFAVDRRDPNALVLDFCRYRCQDGAWSEPLPVIGLHEKLTAQAYRGPVELSFSFRADCLPPSCALVIEDSEQSAASLNGHPLHRSDDAFYRDRGFHRLEATGLVRRGENEVRIARDFVAADATAVSDPERFYGTELEAAYLIGDFAVRQDDSGWVLAPETGCSGCDLLAAGYPFYAGRLALATTLDLAAPQAGERVFLELGPLQAILAKVRVNGHEAGAIAWAPHEIEITPWVRDGANRVEIELVNSLRNLIGPLHRRVASPFEVWDAHFTARTERADWMDQPQRDQLKTWTDEYQLVPLGVDGGARILYRSIA